jgi:SAM-dependent methyltransferase
MTENLELKCLVDDLRLWDVAYCCADPSPPQLWWAPKLDMERSKTRKVIDALVRYGGDCRTLEIGYRWEGRLVPGSTVLDLYDSRPDVDLRLDVCDMAPVSSGRFSLVVITDVLEHLRTPWKAASEIARVSVLGAILYARSPSVWPYHSSGGEGTSAGRTEFGGDYWRFTHQGIESLFDNWYATLALWYIPPDPAIGDDPRSGWGVCYLGERRG